MPSGSRVALTALLALTGLLVLAALGAFVAPVAGVAGTATGSSGVPPGTAGAPAVTAPSLASSSTGAPSAASPSVGDSLAVDGPAHVGVTGQPAMAPGSQGQIGSDDFYQSNTTIAIRLRPDGDARITVTVYRTNLTSATERQAFEDVAASFGSSAQTTRTVNSFRRASSEASQSTGRQMAIENVDPSSSIDEQANGTATGELSISMTWTNFAVAENGRLAVDDVFETRSGTWLSRLEAGQSLLIRPPPGYEPVTVNGNFREPSWHWEGPRSFSTDSHPVAVFSENPLSPLLYGGAVVGGLAVLLVVGYVVARRRDVIGSGRDEPTPAASATAVGDQSTDEGASAPTNGASDDEVDVELLSDEERVERLLEQNGGRMKQASIVKETGWSNAKVSQLLSAMDDDDRIDKLRIGRENLISFPDEDIADVEE